MSDENGTPNGSSQKGPLAVFTQKHNWRKWTAVNDEALGAIVNDEEAQEYRLLALAFIRAWGHPNDPQDAAIDPASGKRMKLANFARELGVSDRTVSRWCEPLAARNQLHVLDSGVYPVSDPSKPFSLARTNGKNRHTPAETAAKYKIFLDHWKKTHPDRAHRQHELRGELKQIRCEQLGAYKLWLKEEESAGFDGNGRHTPPDSWADSSENTGGLPPPINKERARVSIEDLYAGKTAANESSSAFVEDPPPPAPVENNVTVLEALREYRPTDPEAANRLVKACRRNCPDATEQEIVHFVHAKGAQLTADVDNPIGLFLKYVPAYFTPNFRATLPPRLQTCRVTNGMPLDRHEARRQADRDKFMRWTQEDLEYARRQQAEGDQDA